MPGKAMTMLRTGLERLTRDWSFTRRMPANFGNAPIKVSTAGGLRYLLKPMSSIDPDLLNAAEELVAPGSVVWDVGANVGLFSVAAAQRAGKDGRVFAIEADTWLVGLLRKTASMQDDSSAPIEVVPIAAAEHFGVARFCVAKRGRSSNYLQGFGFSQAGGVSEVQRVVTLPLDTLAESLDPPQVVKIDVEGAELDVLRGARHVLEKHRPLVLCEVGSAASTALAKFLQELGYVVFDSSKPAQARTPIEKAPWSTLGIPSDRRDVLARLSAA